MTEAEEERYLSIYTILLMSGEYREEDIEAQVQEIKFMESHSKLPSQNSF